MDDTPTEHQKRREELDKITGRLTEMADAWVHSGIGIGMIASAMMHVSVCIMEAVSLPVEQYVDMVKDCYQECKEFGEKRRNK